MLAALGNYIELFRFILEKGHDDEAISRVGIFLILFITNICRIILGRPYFILLLRMAQKKYPTIYSLLLTFH